MFRGENIYLRNVTSDDLDLILAWENNPDNWKVSSTTKPYNREQIEEFVNLKQDIFEYEQLRLIICLNTTNEIIGNIDLFDFEDEHKREEYKLQPELDDDDMEISTRIENPIGHVEIDSNDDNIINYRTINKM